MYFLQSILSEFNACLHAFSAIFLLFGWAAVKCRRIVPHRLFMSAAFFCLTLIFVGWIFQHNHVDPVRFNGVGLVRPFYFMVLFSHAALAAAIVPMVLRGLFLAWSDRFAEHARLSRWTFPLWLYVAVTGMLGYWLLYRVSTPGFLVIEDRIKSAATSPGAPAWAGMYYDDGGHHGSDEAVILSTAGYYYDGNRWSSLNRWGTVAQSGDGVLLLSPGGWLPAKKLRLIPWDDRVYAIDEDQKLEFINNVNQYLGPEKREFVWQMPYKAPKDKRGGMFRKVPAASGLPRVPDDWRPLLLRRLVEATIIKVGPIRYVHDIYPRRIAVVLDAGRRHGLVPGIEMRVRNFESDTHIVLTSVAEDSASGEAWQSDAIQPFESQRLPWVGQKAVSYVVYGDVWETR